MKDQTFIIRNKEIRTEAAKAVMAITGEPLCEVLIRPHVRIRTDAQNSRYWVDLTEQLKILNQEINTISEHTGYNPLEVRRLIAKQLEPEQAAILYTRSPDAAHEVLKIISGIPTSTRLGTKKFSEFEDRMVQIVVEIIGVAKAIAREAA